MAPQTINLLITTFPGLGLPSTLSIQVPSTSLIREVERLVSTRLPSSVTNLTLTTTSNKLLSTRRSEPITSLLASEDDAFLPLRLSAQLCGGKGGFGSQLRAAGGRMSSRKKKGQGETNGSMRNLDGRRLRTVTEAKALAEYLALKPEMDKREKEERRKRWEQVVQLAEDKQEEIRSGNKGKVDGKWLEDKEEASEKTRAAVIASLTAGEIKNLLGQAESDISMSGSEGEESESEEGESSAAAATKIVSSEKKSAKDAPARTFFGWDEDEDMSDSSEEEAEEEEEEEEPAKEPSPPPPPVAKAKGRAKGKGKAKA